MAFHQAADVRANYERFVETVRESCVVWGLRAEAGWAHRVADASDRTVILFWSDEDQAGRHAIEEWSSHRVTPITLDEFVDNWLTGMQGGGVLAGINFNEDFAGLEIEPVELGRRLQDDA